MDQQLTHLTIPRVALHTLYAGRKLIKAIGPLELISANNTLYIRINHWYTIQIFKHQQFYKLTYDDYATYITQNIAGGFFAISIPKTDPQLPLFESKIKQFTLLIDFVTGNKQQEFVKKIEYHYPEIQENPIHTDDLFTPFFSIAAKVQNRIGWSWKPSVLSESLRVRTKGIFSRGWERIRGGFRRVNEKSNELPGVLATKQFVSEAANKISESTKKVVEDLTNQNVQPSNL